jgi:hypothetical protein
MKLTANILALSIGMAVAATTPAHAAPEAPPLPGDVHCRQTAKPAYRLAAVEKRGLDGYYWSEGLLNRSTYLVR